VKYINDNILPAMNLMIDGFKDDGLSGAIEYFAASFGSGSTDVLNRVRDLILGFTELEKKFVKLAAPLFVLIDLGRAFVDMLSGGDGVITIEQQLIDRTDQVNAMFDQLIARVDAAKYRLDLFRNSAINVNNALVDANARMENFGKRVKAVKPAAEEAEEKTDGFGRTVDVAAEKAKKMAARVKELSDALETEMAAALKGAEDNLALAEKAFDDFAGSVSSVIEDTIDFAAALEKSGEEGGKSFFDELQDQADRAKEFGILVEKLLAAGLSEEALNEVLAAGVDAGTSIAKELLGSAEGVLRANKLVEETQKIATAIGQAAAAKFYQAGVDNGQAYLRGVEEAIAAANARISGAQRPADIKGAQAIFGASVGTAGTGANVVNNYNILTETIDPAASARAVQNALIEANKLYGPLDIQIAF
jgi:hypothetical protein